MIKKISIDTKREAKQHKAILSDTYFMLSSISEACTECQTQQIDKNEDGK